MQEPCIKLKQYCADPDDHVVIGIAATGFLLFRVVCLCLGILYGAWVRVFE